MKRLKNVANRIWDKLLIACGTLCVLLPTNPWSVPLASRDAGVFLYVGWRILNGELPYRDVWDHKPPIIFYINALGLAITDHSRWGVWLLEFVSLFVAASIGFHLVKKALGTFPAIYSLVLGLLTLTFLISAGNLTEEYALPLQFLAFWLIYDADRPSFSLWRWFFLGFTGALAFFTKQTTIGIWLAIVLYWTLTRLKARQTRQWLKALGSFAAGGLLVACALVLFFAVQGALVEFWDAAFRYNAIYASATTDLLHRLAPLLLGIGPLARAGLLQFAAIGYALGIGLLLFRQELVGDWTPLLFVALLDLPIEFILVSASGKSYPHYYMSLLPVLFLFSALTFWIILSQLSAWNLPNHVKSAFQLGIVAILLWSSLDSYRDQVSGLEEKGDEAVVDFVESDTAPDDCVLLWGAESTVNFFAQRKSPTRYVYQYPLYTPGYVDEQMVLQFLEDIIHNRPRLIIDTRNPKTPMIDFPIHTEAIAKEAQYVRSHYRPTQVLGDWTFYEYTDLDLSPLRSGP
jgi:hypothetical protein